MKFEEKIKTLKQRIHQAERILISTHRNPDGDAMGSSLAWYLTLKKCNKNVAVILPDAYPEFYAWMPAASECLIYEHQAKEIKERIGEADLIFSLDYNAFHRTTEGLSHALHKSSAFKVLVDHHREPEHFDLMFSDIQASSTSEMVYQLIEGLDYMEHMDLDIAACLYTGIVTDTASFRFSSTSAYTMKIAAHLLEIGLDSSKIQSLIYDNNSEHRLRLMGYALSEKMVVNHEKAYAYIALSSEELQNFNYQKGDTEGLVNYPLSIAAVKISVLVSQRDDEFRLSFRSKNAVDVNALARKYFHGGGHMNAAGGVSKSSLEETIQMLEQYLPEFST